MTQQKLILHVCLTHLADMRFSLIQDFVDLNPNIYLPMFKYWNNSDLMYLSLEIYLLTWFSKHLSYLDENLIQNFYINESIRNKILNIYAQVIYDLIEDHGFPKNHENIIINNKFFIELLSKKVAYLQNLKNIGDNYHYKLYNRLKYAIEKNIALFEREIIEFKQQIGE